MPFRIISPIVPIIAVISVMLLWAPELLAADQPAAKGGTSPSEAATSLACGSDEAALAAFADLFMRERSAMKPADKLSYDASANRVAIQPTSGSKFDFLLGNARTDFCKAEPEDRRAVLLRYVSISASVADIAVDHVSENSLMPAVRGRSHFALMELQSRLDGREPAQYEYVRTFGSDIIVQIAADSESTLAYLTRSGIAKTGLSRDQAFDKALANLRTRSNKNWLELRPGLYVSPWHDAYDGSRLLLLDLVRHLSLKGEPVAMAPDPDTLLVTGSDDIPNLQEMARLARKHLEEATRPLSGQAIVLRGDEWVDFVPKDPVLDALIDIQRERLSLDYGQQQELLQRHVGDDVYVAQYDLVKNADLGGLRSFATWSEGIQTLLPRTDLIGLVTQDGEVMMLIPWAAVQQVAGGYMVQTEWYPPRFEVNSFPNAAELAKLKRHDLMGN